MAKMKKNTVHVAFGLLKQAATLNNASPDTLPVPESLSHHHKPPPLKPG